MALTGSIVTLSDALVTKLTTNKTALGLYGVFYGDQDQIPGTPIACVEPDTKSQDYKSSGSMFRVELNIDIIVYANAVTSPQTNRRDADLMAEKIEDLVHLDRQLNNGTPGNELVIECHVAEVKSGYVNKANTVYRASRLSVVFLTQKQLP